MLMYFRHPIYKLNFVAVMGTFQLIKQYTGCPIRTIHHFPVVESGVPTEVQIKFSFKVVGVGSLLSKEKKKKKEKKILVQTPKRHH